MRFDELTNFGEANLTGNSVEFGNKLDLGNAEISMGQSFIVVSVSTKVTAETKVELQTSSTDSDYVGVASTTFKANSEVGTQQLIVVPPQCSRYLKLVATGTTMGGKLKAALTLCAQSVKGIECYKAS